MKNIITSKDNPVIKLYQKLSSSKKERIQYGLFVLEGLRITEDALKESNVSNLILTENAYDKYSAYLFQADLRDTKTIVISNELGNRISSTGTTQGVFAICHIPQQHTPVFRSDDKYIVLYGLQDPGNVGMIIRTADALGMDGIILSNSCDLYSPKVIRSTMGSVFRTNLFIENDTERLFSMFEGNNVITSAAVIDSNEKSMNAVSMAVMPFLLAMREMVCLLKFQQDATDVLLFP